MGLLLALVSGLLWGTADFLGGTASRRLPVVAVVLGSQVCAFVVMVAVATASGSWSAPTGYLVWGVLAGVTGLLGLGLFYSALASGTMGIVSPITALGVLVPLGFALVSGEAPTAGQYVGIGLALTGVVLASGPELSGAASPRPVLLAAAAAVALGLSMTFIAQGAQIDVVMTMLTMRVVSVVAAGVALVVARSAGGVTRRDIGLLAAIGAFDVLANVAYGAASQQALLALVSVLGSLYPVVTVILAWRVHHERLAAVQYTGVAVALGGVAVIAALGAG